MTGKARAGLFATPGALQTQDNAGTCFTGSGTGISTYQCDAAFVVKLDPAGALLFATYLGGNGSTLGTAIAVDQQSNVYIAGLTSANSDGANTFPVTPGAAFTDPATGTAFVVKLNPSGSQLLYSTYIPATLVMAGLAVDPGGNAYITGTVSYETSFPTTAGAFQVVPNPANTQYPGFIAKLNASGSALAYATYLSGSGVAQGGADSLNAIAVDAAGDAFITGSTMSADFPVTPGAFRTTNPGQQSVFLSKLNPQGSGLLYSTYLGQGNGTSVKLDAQGTAFVAGTANPANFPTTPGGVVAGGGFLTRFSADGSSLIYSILGPSPVSVIGGVFVGLDVDAAGDASITGTATSGDLPVGVGAFQPEYSGGSSDVYVARFLPDGQLAGATYLGGSDGGTAAGIALGPNGSVVVAGFAAAPNLPGVGIGTFPGDVLTPFVTSIFPSLTVENAASFVANGIAPGEIVALRGYGIGPATGLSAAGPATQLGGVQVSFGGFEAPLFYAQSGQINAQVPWELAGQTSTMVQVSYPGIASTRTPVVLTPSVPGIFYVNNSDGTQNSPSNPARAGNYVAVYGTGGGVMNPAGVTGSSWPLLPLSQFTQPVSVTVGGETAGVLYAGSAPLMASGVFQINVRLPADLTPAAQFLCVKAGGVTSAAAAISIQ